MSMSYKCTVIRVERMTETGAFLYKGTCDNTATEEVYMEDIADVNINLRSEGLVLVGNYICNEHARTVGDI